jgi:hypothetical protein
MIKTIATDIQNEDHLMKRIATSFYFISLFLFLSVSIYSSPAMSVENQDKTWSYNISKDGWETTVRNYLLMHHSLWVKEISEADKGKRIYVKSTCGRGIGTEGSYGTCTHEIEIQPKDVKFTLKTGEDVVRIYMPPFNSKNKMGMMIVDGGSEMLILGTVEPGCCDSPTVVRYYTETGRYLGKLTKRRASGAYSTNNLITRTYNQGNTIEYNGNIYTILDKENGGKGYEVLMFREGMDPVRIPISFAISDAGSCEDWNIKRFLYGIGSKGMGVFLTLEGQECKSDTGTIQKEFTCYIDDKSVSCVPIDIK